MENLNSSSNIIKKEKYSEDDLNKIKEDLDSLREKYGFIVSNKIGQGGFSIVYIGQRENRQWAIKLVYIREDDNGRTANMAKSEMIISCNLKNKNCVRSFGFYELKNSKVMVFEYAMNKDLSFLIHLFYSGQLFSYLKNEKNKNNEKNNFIMDYMSESMIRFFISQIVSSLEYLRKMNFIHKDLKPENCLLTKSFQIRLSDFALSTSVPHYGEMKLSGTGTGVYMPPETFDPEKKSIPVKEAYKVDYYALGIILYKMLVNNYVIKPDREGKFDYELLCEKLDEMKEMGVKYYERIGREGVTDEVVDLINKLLCKNIQDRADISEIVNHPWFKIKEEEIRNLNEFNDNDYFKFILELQKLDYYNLNKGSRVGDDNKKDLKNKNDTKIDYFHFNIKNYSNNTLHSHNLNNNNIVHFNNININKNKFRRIKLKHKLNYINNVIK